MFSILKLAIVGLALVMGPSVAASSLGATSAATMTIRVTIPPFRAALAAQTEGAVGIWTVKDDENALMVKVPDTLIPGESLEAAVYTGSTMLFSMAPELGSRLNITAGAATIDNGLARQAYRVSAAAGIRATQNEASLIIISAI